MCFEVLLTQVDAYLFPVFSCFLAVMCSTDPHVLLKYRAGYSACVAEVSKSVIGDECLDPDVKVQILSHLAGCPATPRVVSDVALQSSSRIPTSIQLEASGDLGVKEPRQLLPRDTLEPRPPSARTAISPHVVQGHRILPSTGTIPLHYVPVLGTDSSSSPGMHHALVPIGSSSGLHLTDPLWRPW